MIHFKGWIDNPEGEYMRVLWDFDGTLFDTYPCYVRTLCEVIGGNVNEETMMKKMKKSFGFAIDFFKIPKEVVEKYIEVENALPPDTKPPFPYVKEVLSQTSLNVIMTHKPREEVQTMLNYYGWEHLFTEIVCGDDGYPRKPNPESYHYLHNKYHIDLAVGDRKIDLLPAHKLGIKTCLFNPNDDADQNAIRIADFIVRSYQEFFQVVQL
jgi:phosphoglycolate phosphatase-like HAD superfamily hydrolase